MKYFYCISFFILSSLAQGKPLNAAIPPNILLVEVEQKISGDTTPGTRILGNPASGNLYVVTADSKVIKKMKTNAWKSTKPLHTLNEWMKIFKEERKPE